MQDEGGVDACTLLGAKHCIVQLLRYKIKGWDNISSVAKHLPSMGEALGSVSSTKLNQTKCHKSKREDCD